MKRNLHPNISDRLIKKQGISEADAISLNTLHNERAILFKNFELKKLKKLSRDEIDELILELEDLEFIMQAIWKFDQNKKRHTWWNQVPNCNCKAIGHYGGDIKREINLKCPVHGKSKLKF